MNMKIKKYNFFQRIIRAFKLNFIKLFRSPGGAKKVAMGFAIGFALEMLVISSASLIYILFIPIVRFSKGSLPAAVIGNVIGKLTFLPVLLLPFARKIGKLFYPTKVRFGHQSSFSMNNILHGDFHSLINLLHGGIHVLIGMTIFGIILGIVSYFVIYYFYEKERMKRVTRIRIKHFEKKSTLNNNLI
jgi:uncharacterized protein (DUF2062 family)